ncbi:MAG: superoxide dismutase family protein [Candidatus Rokubacteria bacterium]|nr:superoxide dismutase family protein [Candidatus Rokubacteria bacterium]
MTRVAVVLGLAAAGCSLPPTRPVTDNIATAELRTPAGEAVGAAVLTDLGDGVRVVLETKAMPPGAHAVHVHETGTCDPPDFTTAGGHFNPDRKQHGLLNPAGPHAGDLPNITIAADGTGRLESFTKRLTVGPGATSLFDADGSALVVHAQPDDFTTDPTGNSGARLACGVIVKAQPGA